MESDTPLSRSEMLERGREMRRKLVGDAYADKLDSEVYRNRHMQKFGDLTQEIVFGQMWTRSGLDLKLRSLIILITDTATGSTEALQLHVRFCRIHGWSEDEIVESILHCMGYIAFRWSARRWSPRSKYSRQCRPKNSSVARRMRSMTDAPQRGCAERSMCKRGVGLAKVRRDERVAVVDGLYQS